MHTRIKAPKLDKEMSALVKPKEEVCFRIITRDKQYYDLKNLPEAIAMFLTKEKPFAIRITQGSEMPDEIPDNQWGIDIVPDGELFKAKFRVPFIGGPTRYPRSTFSSTSVRRWKELRPEGNE